MMLNTGPKKPRHARTKGYSFPEVLFAVIILGIGFIMIAAIFPVALQQSRLTMDETTSASLARGASNLMSQLANNTRSAFPVLRATGEAAPFPGEVCAVDTATGWDAIRGSLIFGQNPRYGFVVLYRRDGDGNKPPLPYPANYQLVPPAPSGQIYVIAAQCRGERNAGMTGTIAGASVPVPARSSGQFDQYDVNLDVVAPTSFTLHVSTPYHPYPPITNPNNLSPHQIKISLTDNYNASGVDILQVNAAANTAPGAATENLPDAIAEGAFIVMRLTGRIYRVGVPRPDIATTGTGYPAAWELQPGNDERDNTEDVPANTNAWVVGRQRLPNGNFEGSAQDVAIYTTFVQIQP